MCTVSFVPIGDKVLIASNRDEKHWRDAALPPHAYETVTGKIWYPRDAHAGGTWLGVHERGTAVVLLNGGFVKHEPSPPYEKSRGLVLLDLLQTKSPYDHFRSYPLEFIEPFTLVIWQDQHLFECRWDGSKKHSLPLNKEIPHIWSSVTLYPPEIIAKRKNWFGEWLANHPAPNLKDLLYFHEHTGDGDKENDLLMDRDGQVFTVSITGMELGKNEGEISYLDIQTRQSLQQSLRFTQVPLIKL